MLDSGEIPLASNDLVIDCTASGISRTSLKPIWADKRITLELVRTCQPLFSAAFIGFVEATFDDQAMKNAICTPVPLPLVDSDWLKMFAVTLKNRVAWTKFPQIEKWLAQSRLNGFFALAAQVKPDETAKLMALQQFQTVAMAVAGKLPVMMKALG